MAIQELSDGGPEGTRVGSSSSEKVAFWGKTPVAQQASLTAATAGMTAPDLVPIINGIITRLEVVGIVAEN